VPTASIMAGKDRAFLDNYPRSFRMKVNGDRATGGTGRDRNCCQSIRSGYSTSSSDRPQLT